MVALVLGVGLVMCLWAWVGGERIDTNDGTGFDGKTYARIVAHPELVFDHGLDMHRIQRVAPSLLVYALLAPFGVNGNPVAVIAVFQVLNFLALALAALLWWKVARHLELARAAAWLGFIALLVNYPSLKLSAFYPILTDRFGFLLGMVLVWLIVANRTWQFLVVAVVGSFTWPTATYSAVLAFVMAKTRPLTSVRPVWGTIGALVAAAVVVAGAIRAHSCGLSCVTPVMVDTTIEILVPVSIVLVAVWIFLALQPLVARLTPQDALAAVIWRRIPVALAVLFVISQVQHSVAKESTRTLGRTLANTALGSIVKPLGFLVLEVTYYGPAVLLLILTWRIAVRQMATFGPRMICLLIVFLLLGISTEPRVIVNQWPFFALAVALVANTLGWSMRAVWIFGATALVTSRVWLPIAHGPITPDWQTYPSQWYFMSNGPTTTAMSYVALATLTLAAGAVMWWLLRTQRAESAGGAGRPVDATYRH